MSEQYFKLGIEGEGFYFFLPDNYKHETKVIGSSLRRTITGKARRDVITTKKVFELGFADASDQEYISLYTLFESNLLEGKKLLFSDEKNTFEVIWSGEDFGLSDRVQGGEIYWSGTIQLEEI